MTGPETAEWLASLFGDAPIAVNSGHVLEEEPEFGVLRVEGADGVLVVATTDLSQWEQGVETSESADGETTVDLRSELVLSAREDSVAAEPFRRAVTVVLGCATIIARGGVAVQPGLIIEDIIPGPAGGAVDPQGPRHALLVPPILWSAGVPRMTEPHQVTTLLQIIPVTPAEKNLAETRGLDVLQQAFVDARVDLWDLDRSSAVSATS